MKQRRKKRKVNGKISKKHKDLENDESLENKQKEREGTKKSQQSKK